MSLSIIYCFDCFQKLQEWGELPVLVYEHVCEYYALHNEPLEICEEIHHYMHGFLAVIQYLENKRYLCSTESGSDTIRIMPLGIYQENNKDSLDYHFCATPHLHGHL